MEGGQPQGVVAFGHLHIPSGARAGQRLVNVSSVSMPGDDDPRAKYGLFTWDGEAWSFERCYVHYALGQQRQAYRHHQPPGWPSFVEQIDHEGFVPQKV